MPESIFYVYAYLDPRKKGDFIYKNVEFEYEPFYIGKGSEHRHKTHLREAKKENSKDPNKYKINKIKSILKEGLEPIVLIIKDFLSEEESFELERTIINEIGRWDKDNSKPLLNMTDGGEGPSGKILSQETKDLLREINIGKNHTEETRRKMSEGRIGEGNWIYGKGHSEETKQVISSKAKDRMTDEYKEKLIKANKVLQKGGKLSDEHKKKIGDSVRGKNGKVWIVTSEKGEVIEVNSIRNFCKERGINYNTFYYRSLSKKEFHCGWIARLKDV